MSDGSGYAIDYFYANRNKKQYKLTINGNYIADYIDTRSCIQAAIDILFPEGVELKEDAHITSVCKLNEDFYVWGSDSVVNITEVN